MAIYSRVMLKLSGEVLGGDAGIGLDRDAIQAVAAEIRQIAAAGVELAIVIGGGNFLRGAQCDDLAIERATADYMGMAATVLNALALQAAVEAEGYATRVMSSIQMNQIAEPYIRRRAIGHLDKGRVLILAGGTGNPYCTTDTAAALRAVELDCKVLLKATKVDGIYTEDPVKNPDALRYDRVTYLQAIRENLGVMDATAFTYCSEFKLPIIVYCLREPGNTFKAITGQPIGTIVTAGE